LRNCNVPIPTVEQTRAILTLWEREKAETGNTVEQALSARDAEWVKVVEGIDLCDMTNDAGKNDGRYTDSWKLGWTRAREKLARLKAEAIQKMKEGE
jgi:hypothetical protein